MTQSEADVQVATTAEPPPTGAAVKINAVNGPPVSGALALSIAANGVTGSAEDIVVALQIE
jgi:hypothetical protein